jgi:protein CMS1
MILCSSAVRAVEVIKCVCNCLVVGLFLLMFIFSKQGMIVVPFFRNLQAFNFAIGRLFAKHLKVADQTEQLSKIFHPIVVGTPGRLKKLLEMDALSLEHTTHLVFDMQKDKKNMTVLDVKDTAKECMDLLQFYAIPRLNQDDKLKLVLY